MSELPKGWMSLSLSEIGQWGSGGTPRTTARHYYEGNIPWIRSGDLPDGPILQHSVSISEEAVANSAAKWVPANAVLIAMYGATIGKLGLTTYPVTTNQAVATCDCNDAVLPKFLFCLLRQIRSDLIEMGQGGAQPNISQQLLKQVEIGLPPLAEQRRIVAKLDQLMARTARARAELARIPALIAHHKRAILAAAFDPELVRSASRVALADVVQILSGFAFASADYVGSGVPLIRIGDIRDGRVIWSDDTRFLPETFLKRHSAFQAFSGDVLIALSGATTGKTGVYQYEEPALINQRVACLRARAKSKIDQRYIALLCDWLTPQILEGAQGGAQPNISPKKISAALVAWPEQDKRAEAVSRLTTAFA